MGARSGEEEMLTTQGVFCHAQTQRLQGGIDLQVRPRYRAVWMGEKRMVVVRRGPIRMERRKEWETEIAGMGLGPKDKRVQKACIYKKGRRHGWEETNTGLWVSQRQRDSQGRSLAMQKKPDFFRQRK